MNQNLANHLPLDERHQFLSDNCTEIEKMSYMKQFSTEELSEMKSRLSDVSIVINDLEDEKKSITSGLTKKIKDLKTENKSLLSNLKHKSVQVTEDVYKFIEHDDNTAYFYNSTGQLIYQRPLLPNERQMSILSIKKEGTND